MTTEQSTTEQSTTERSPTGHSAGAAVVAQLEAHGVRRVHGVPGESYLAPDGGFLGGAAEVGRARRARGGHRLAGARPDRPRQPGLRGLARLRRVPGARRGAGRGGPAGLRRLRLLRRQYGTIRAHQERGHPGRVSGTAQVNPDFGAYARAFGGYGERVSDTAALDRVLAAGTVAVLHLDVDPDVLVPRGVTD